MRAFLGVRLPTLPGLVTVLEDLRASTADLKLVDAGHFHLTLNFLDEVSETMAASYVKLLRDESLPAPFEVTLRDVGAFPNWKKLNVLWAGVQDPVGGLSKLHVAALRAWTSLGHLGENREFHPHLTLARKRSKRGLPAARRALEGHRQETFGAAKIDRVTLFRSTLSPEGPVYDTVEDVPL